MPAAQAVQEGAPLPPLNLPAAQAWQQEEPVAHALNLPAAHAVQDAAPSML